jgi:nucleotide-binding universal stress UspA family protein
MFTRILVPTDFSPCADAALNHARAIADKFEASLQLLHVVRDPVATTTGTESHAYHYAFHYFDGVPDLVELRDVLLREAGRQIVQRITAADRTGLHAVGEAVIGFGARTVVEYAESYGADLIVMGTHGGGMSQLPIGRFAGHVIRTAPCAVMAVCEGGSKGSSPDTRSQLEDTRGENPPHREVARERGPASRRRT